MSRCGTWGNHLLYAMGRKSENFFCSDKDGTFYQRDRIDSADDRICDLYDQ